MLSQLEKIIDIRSAYTTAHLVKTILLLYNKPFGREILMRTLQLNEASARTLINTLEKNNIVQLTTKGAVLTKKGKRIVSYIKKFIKGPKIVEKTNLTISKYNVAYLIRNKSYKIKKGLEQRDHAILAGADGLTTIVYKKIFYMPGFDRKIPEKIKNIFKVKNYDVILIGSAKEKFIADIAALNASLLLLQR